MIRLELSIIHVSNETINFAGFNNGRKTGSLEMVQQVRKGVLRYPLARDEPRHIFRFRTVQN